MTISKFAVGALMALMLACSGGTTGTGENPTPVTISNLEMTSVLQTQATFTFKVSRHAVRVTGTCQGVGMNDWHEELDAFTSDGENYTYIAGQRTPLLVNAPYDFIVKATHPDGDVVEQKISFTTKPKDVPVDEKWQFLLNSDLQGHIKQVPPPGKENDPLWNFEGELQLVDDPTYGKLIGEFNGADHMPFDTGTLVIHRGGYTGFIAPCDSSVLTLWTAEVRAKVDQFNQDHSSCRDGVKWRIENYFDGVTDLYEIN